jgi:hypothetical protein
MAPSRITLAERVEAIQARTTQSDTAVCKRYRTSLRTLQRWSAAYAKLAAETKMNGKRATLHRGRLREKEQETRHLMAVVDDMILTGAGLPIYIIQGIRAPALAVMMMRAHPTSFSSYPKTCRWVYGKLKQNSKIAAYT